MSKRFCPKCGIEILEGTFCENCIKKQQKFEIPLIQISEFNRTFFKGAWQPFDNIEHLVIKRVREVVGKDIPIQIEPFDFEPRPKEKKTIKVQITIDEKKIKLPVKISYMQCDFGQKQKTQYYEGIMQLRNPTDEVIEFIQSQMKAVAPKGVFITKVVESKNGVDLHFTKKNPMRLIAQKVVSRFGGTAEDHAQLFSHNHLTSKDLFRLNIIVEIPKFTINDVISFDLKRIRGEDIHHVAQINKMGKIIHATDLLSGKNMAFELKYAKEIEKVEKHKTTVIATNPEIQVLHPETYQNEIPRNIKAYNKPLKMDSEVFVVLVKEGLLLTYDK